MADTFNVGDKVIVVTGYGTYGPIGEVIRITDKRNDVKVWFKDGNRVETYTQGGYQRGHDVWNPTHIRHYTDAVAKEIADRKVVRACINAMKELANVNKLSPNMARRILNAINQEKEGSNE